MPAFSKIHIVYLTVLYFTALLPHSTFALQVSTQTQLAKVYEENTSIPISDYLVSEKYDGIRAIWTGSELLTRQGNPISAPEWFTAPLPGVWLDGELWTKRQNFEDLSSIVRTQIPEEERWREVQYMVFDMPDAQLPFEERYKNYSNLIEQINTEHIKAVKQQRFHSNHELSKHLQAMVENGAEGLMLHLATAPHQSGRSDALLKLKPYFDDEAEVIAHLPGKGKYTGMLGALRVRNQQGIEFSIGTGFTDAERANPPPVGSIITYKYHGYTNNGVPRFASFLRIREGVESE
ncbi:MULTISPECIES: DNA ligase [Idiomarina]|jgi:DNA ligase-1|uniref:DNA ligase n=1 Tax=Idiomarina TaxID=135575 RepID=UPI000C096F50|nr:MULTISPECIES: DNA ligase [Idiomarina]MAC34080.1 DNA ligase [Haliea sp.]MAO66947.1 DNA ligase [Idiomarina sp.]MBF81615.1 DNA ligase [Idiomarina sp.]|tara:strand:- start:807 stop:1682 length:876 start_codon:yes stop_codon:yes gene_type:complete